MIHLSFSLSASLSLPLDSMAIGSPPSSSSLEQPPAATALSALATGDPPPSLSLHPPPETHPSRFISLPKTYPSPSLLSLFVARFNSDRCPPPSLSLEQTSAATALPPTAAPLSGADVFSYRPPSPFIPFPRPTNLPLCFSLFTTRFNSDRRPPPSPSLEQPLAATALPLPSSLSRDPPSSRHLSPPPMSHRTTLPFTSSPIRRN